MAASEKSAGQPIRRLPEIPPPPKRGAVTALRKALVARGSRDPDEHGLSEEAAEAIAVAVADPAQTRTVALGHVSFLQVPGGTLTVLRDRLLVNRVITYPVNPRVLDSQRYPAAAGPGAKDRLFWPERDLSPSPDDTCELLLRGGMRLRVASVLQDHAKRLVEQNKLDTILELGVLRPILVMPMLVRTDEDDEPPVMALTSVEGSSRTAWSHRGQHLDAAAPLYGATADPAAAQAVARTLSDVRNLPLDAVTTADLQRVRTLLIPAEIIIGFEPDASTGDPSLPAVIDQLLGLTHIDPPRPWSEQATESKIGEKVLAQLRETGHIQDREHAWLAGMLSPEEAEVGGLDPWVARRAARLLWFASRDPDDSIGNAVADGVRKASFQRRVSREARADAVAALALRAFDPGSVSDPRAVRAALPRAMRVPSLYVTGVSGNGQWATTSRSPEQLRDAALEELAKSQVGGATLELTALASWALVTNGLLSRGSAKSRKDGDPRDPERILTVLMGSERGIRVLHRAVADDLVGQAPRQIDLETFVPVPTADGGWVPLTESWLRQQAAPPPRAPGDPAPAPDETATMTPLRQLDLRLEAIDTHVTRLDPLLDELVDITEDDGTPVIDLEGIDDARSDRWTNALVRAITRIGNHRQVYNNRYGSLADPEDEDESDTS